MLFVSIVCLERQWLSIAPRSTYLTDAPNCMCNAPDDSPQVSLLGYTGGVSVCHDKTYASHKVNYASYKVNYASYKVNYASYKVNYASYKLNYAYSPSERILTRKTHTSPIAQPEKLHLPQSSNHGPLRTAGAVNAHLNNQTQSNPAPQPSNPHTRSNNRINSPASPQHHPQAPNQPPNPQRHHTLLHSASRFPKPLLSQRSPVNSNTSPSLVHLLNISHSDTTASALSSTFALPRSACPCPDMRSSCYKNSAPRTASHPTHAAAASSTITPKEQAAGKAVSLQKCTLSVAPKPGTSSRSEIWA